VWFSLSAIRAIDSVKRLAEVAEDRKRKSRRTGIAIGLISRENVNFPDAESIIIPSSVVNFA